MPEIVVGIDLLLQEAEELVRLGIPAIALFPVVGQNPKVSMVGKPVLTGR